MIRKYGLVNAPVGAQGMQGDLGPTGPTGPQGIRGPGGSRGQQGDVGPTGPSGVLSPEVENKIKYLESRIFKLEKMILLSSSTSSTSSAPLPNVISH